MPAINPALVPTIGPGRLFTSFVTDQSLNIRWLAPNDVAHYESLNRPLVDEVLRTLVLAKAVDNLYSSLGSRALYPFLVQPRISSGTSVTDVPLNWIWDLSLALPKKWEKPRLAKIKRIAGVNDSTAGYTGFLRLIFTAQQQDSLSEEALFWVDYHIDSPLSYQLAQLQVCDSNEELAAIAADEAQTIAGTLSFRTLDVSNAIDAAFLELVAPGGLTDADSGGYYDNPAVYELVDTVAGGTNLTGDYSTNSLVHGTGLLVDSAWVPLPALDSDAQSWLNSFNYPFDQQANRTSTAGIQIPLGMFREFQLTAPAGDEPTGVSSPAYFPVWVSRIEQVATNHLRWYFATHNTTESETGGNPSLAAIEFASLDLERSYQPGDVVPITPLENLQLQAGSDSALFYQHFGRGHVVLSSIWGSGVAITDFFAAFAAIIDNPQDTSYTQSSTRISSFGLSRVPKYTPTVGQARALTGSTARFTTPIPPSQDNRFVTEQDQGLGNQVDLESQPGITPVAGIERYGNSGTLCHKIFRLVIKGDQIVNTNSSFYANEVLPRIRLLLGRDPVYGDIWGTGNRFVIWNGDAWQSMG